MDIYYPDSMPIYQPHPVEVAIHGGFVLSGPAESNPSFNHEVDRLWIVYARGQRVAVMASSEGNALRSAKQMLPPLEGEESILDLINDRMRYAMGFFMPLQPRTSGKLMGITRD